MSCIEIEIGLEPFAPDANWIEIDHGSDNVECDPEIDPLVSDYFYVIEDPEDMRNKWLAPKECVYLLGAEVWNEEADGSNSFSISQRVLLPDHRVAILKYEDAFARGTSHRQGVNRVVYLEVSDQLAFRLVNRLGQAAIY